MIVFLIISVGFVIFGCFLFSRYQLQQKWKKSLKGKVVLITGSANGLGKNLCFKFAHEECHIICVDIDTKGNEDTVTKIRKICNTIKIRPYTVDITNVEQVKQLQNRVLNEFHKGIDILVNNAGVVYPSRLLELSDAHVQRIMNINCVSHLWLIRAFLPQMLERNSGHIVAIGSLAIFTTFDSLVPYYGSKFAVRGIMDSLSFELRTMGSNVKTLLVHPSLMHTRLLPKQLFNLGVGLKVINKLPVEITDPKNVAQGIINSIKDERRVYYKPYYHYIFLLFLNLIPQFFLDLFLARVAKIYDLLDPLESID